MQKLITKGVTISVECFYQPEYSNPMQSECMFAYRISIENTNSFAIQLLSRHWYIFDSNDGIREVQGEGVVGVQPIIAPGESYRYVSGCNLKSEMGTMRGSYHMQNLYSKSTFEVAIPSFAMVAPFKLN